MGEQVPGEGEKEGGVFGGDGKRCAVLVGGVGGGAPAEWGGELTFS